MLVTLAQLSQGGSRDRYRSASPAPSERSGRSRGARGAGRGTDRRGAAARAPPPSHLRGFRGACGAGRGRRLDGCRPYDTAGHRFACARRTIEWSGRERRRRGLPSSSTLGGPGPRSGGLFVMNADGSGLRKLTPVAWAMPSWSSDGREIAFVGFVGRQGRACRSSASTGAPARLLARYAAAPAWSPDGRRIAFMRFSPAGRNWGGQNWDVYVMNTDGSGQRRLTRNAWLAAPAWSPDGRKIAFERLAATATPRATASTLSSSS